MIIIKLKNLFVLCILCICSTQIQAQDYPYSTYNYNFIQLNKNYIDFPGDSSQFEHLFRKLDQVIKTGEGKINIIHIGGSHIQAGLYTEVVRKKMQTFFPGLNGGRGLVFPYKMAKSNHPKNFSLTWTGQWETCRNIDRTDCSLGLLGISATTPEAGSTVNLNFNPNYLPYDFNNIIIFNDISNRNFKIEPLNLNCEYTVTEFPEKGYTQIVTEDYIQNIKLKFVQTDSLQKSFCLYGIYTENDNSGIIYNDAGINGARIPSFLKCNLLEQQTQVLNPDLVILSLGTNDTYTTNFRPDFFKNNYLQLIQNIRKAAPEAAILITVPNDSYFRRKQPNANTAVAEKAIYELAEDIGCGIWDFYRVMGGFNSTYLWHKEKLMQNDLIHFTRKGYTIKGNLMFDALLKAYDNHIEKENES